MRARVLLAARELGRDFGVLELSHNPGVERALLGHRKRVECALELRGERLRVEARHDLFGAVVVTRRDAHSQASARGGLDAAVLIVLT